VGSDRVLEHRFGEWDATIISSVPGGPGFFEWELSPKSAQFSTKAAEMAGGADKVKLMRDFPSYLRRFRSSNVSTSARSCSRPVCFERMRVSRSA
jgi:hypothetical protein